MTPFLYKKYSEPQLNFYRDPKKLIADFKKEFKSIKKGLIAIEAIPKEERTIENTLYRLDELYNLLPFPEITILAYTAPDKKLRRTAQKCERKIYQFSSTLSLRKPMYMALKQLQERRNIKIACEDKRFLLELIKDFKQAGVLLPDKERKHLGKINNRITRLSLKFSLNIREDKREITFTQEELSGVPKTSLEKLPGDKSSNFKLKMDYPTYNAVMENADSSDVRQRYAFQFNNRAYPQNIKIIKKVLRLKKEKAALLGYKSIRDFILSDRMAKNHKAVNDFLTNLAVKLRPKFKKNRETLLELNEGRPVRLWDIPYLINKLKKEKYNVDQEEVRQYFPLNRVLYGCMGIYEKLFSIRFKETKVINAWHPEVKKYSVISGNKTIAAVYLDLFPRENKYNHAAQFPLRNGRLLKNGIYESPVVALVCNFTKPGKNQPSLLTMEEVKTFFHEFGHAMHSCLTTAKYGSLSGTEVKLDFVEVPSQMFELWMNKQEIINSFAAHYKTGKKLPAELLKRLTGLSYLQSAARTAGQIFYALYDQALHGPKVPADTTGLWEEMQERIYQYPVHKGTHREASFGHLVSGYSAGYYSYLWSKVISDDMFVRFQKKGLLNPKLGMEFRVKLLSKGNSVEPEKLAEDFLGKKVSLNAFLKFIQ